MNTTRIVGAGGAGAMSGKDAASSAALAYRPDIDGLRAVAVLAVIAFHAGAALLPGGFAGVDVFFVISGYLITGLIAGAIENGGFRFTDFYTRRIKRLLPAYIVVALVTLIASSWLLIPNDYIFYTTSLAASWAFVSNVFFSMLSWGYFGQRTEEFPLLHTWSLSVEEQFYFLFPVLLLVLYRYFRRHKVAVLALIAAALLVLSQLRIGEIKSYFLLTSRAHELLIGALAFFLARRFPPKGTVLPALLAAAGMALILGSFVLLNRNTPFPGFNSLYPCIGAALVIYACRAANPVSAVLASKPLVGVGLISYSLYLWHWPIFVFLRYRQVELTPLVAGAAIALAFVLACLTWRFVEQPVRQMKSIDFKQAFLGLYATPAAAFIAVGLYSYTTEGAPERFSPDVRELISSYSYERDLTRSCSIRAEDYKRIDLDYLQRHCAFGDVSRPKAEVLLMGDSHAHHFKPFVDQLARRAGMKAVYHVQGTCFPTALLETDRHPEQGRNTCQRRNADLLQLAGHFRYVVLAGFWASEPERDLEREMRHVVYLIVKAGAVPVIFKDNPHHEPDLSRCVLFRKRGWVDETRDCRIPYAQVAQAQGRYDGIIDRVQQDYPMAMVIDPKRIMCDRSDCATHASNIAFYKDSNHINTRASQLLGEWYAARVGNPLAGTQSGTVQTASFDR
ncbi:MAG TPA: acyltransferase family protein [Noviherbaspirillum sp.]|uniref:acyltransferase family protein n=1 Tax=Noviherbaspirillum sp. TaxID=1926288 RepID=UPI002D4C912C|nr:acyltransferase family protein [Noviherbaspirillum sp.]HYD97611.1 acyltransferase family protein [Noviherbaspirillum sp.]